MTHAGIIMAAVQDELEKAAGVKDALKGIGRTAKRTAIAGGAIGLGAYALGRGLQAGVRERQKKDREEAIRSARLQGNPAAY